MSVVFERALAAKKEADNQFERDQPAFQGVLVAVDSSNAAVANQPGRVWARPFGQDDTPPIPVFNRKVPPTVGLRVIVKRAPKEPFDWEIFDWDTGQASIRDNYSETALMQRHAHEHLFGGRDALFLYLRAMVPLRTSPQSGLTVQIAPHTYPDQGRPKTFTGQNNFDLSSYVPATGLARVVLLYLDLAGNTIGVVAGATIVDAGPINPARPDPPTGGRPSAWVRLAGDQTAIVESDITDARFILSGGEGGERPDVAARLYLHGSFS